MAPPEMESTNYAVRSTLLVALWQSINAMPDQAYFVVRTSYFLITRPFPTSSAS
jgi:hypothetical protein